MTGGTVQEQLQSIQKNLEDYRDAVKVNGAETVGMTPFDGVTANTVQAALEQQLRHRVEIAAEPDLW